MASTPAALQAAAQPAHPKMPANAFANYCQTRSITDGCSDWQVYAKDWANLSGTDRTPYLIEAAALLAEYQEKAKERATTATTPASAENSSAACYALPEFGRGAKRRGGARYHIAPVHTGVG